MAASKRVVWNDGQLATNTDLTAVMANVDFFLQEVLGRQYGDTDLAATADDAVSGATDLGAAEVPTYGFLGPSLRVYKHNATTIKLLPGLGIQYAAVSGEWPARIIRLDAAATEVTDGIALTSLPTAGNFKRALVLTKARDVDVASTFESMDSLGNVSSTSGTTRTMPEVGAPSGVTTGIVVQWGAAAGSASAAARPAGLVGYVQLAELLVDSTGLVNAANTNGNTSGITDLRPRVRPSKASGAVDTRRATCSMDETTAARSARRLGAKAVGADVVHGIAQIPSSSGIVTLDTSRDWRDMLVRVEYGALLPDANLPGGASDSGAFWNTGPSTSSVGVARWFSGTGSADGLLSYISGVCRTAADDSATELTFFADSTTGALCVYGVAGVSGDRNLFFSASAFGPTGRRPATGVES